jgi:GBP family porin
MKKLLIASAALAMVAGTAQAQSSVTVYGNIDVNYNSTDTTNAGSATSQGDSGLNTSRLGFRGTEDLGAGLKAEFQLESKLTASTGVAGSTTANQTFNREAWVGLSDAKLGSIRMGTTDITGAQGLDSTVGQVGNLSDADSNLGTDVTKAVRYTTPTFAGFSAQVGYSNPDATTSAEATTARLTSAYAQYESGKLGVYAGQVSKKISATYDQKETTYGVKYDFGVATVGAYRSTRDNATSGGAAGDLTQTIFSVSAPVAMLGSGVKVHAAYHQTESDVAQTSDNNKTTVAVTKAFSKRTTGYVAYVDKGFETSATADTKAYIVGVNHAF